MSLDFETNKILAFHETKLYQVLRNDPVHKVASNCLELIESGRDVTLKNEKRRGFLFLVGEEHEKFSKSIALPCVYQLCYGGIDVNNKDVNGNAVLHELVLKRGVYRIIIALIRCGADPLIRNNDGLTPLDVLRANKLDGWEENEYWLNLFSPGLANEIRSEDPALKKVEFLLKSWSLVNITNERRGFLNLVEEVENREFFENKNAILQLMRKHQSTNDYVLASMCGSIKWMDKAFKSSRPDINCKDTSYRFHYQYPAVYDRPLIAALCESNNYLMIEHFLKNWPDTSTPYGNETSGDDCCSQPFFFHCFNGQPKIGDYRIIKVIVSKSNTLSRNGLGQNVLFTAMKNNFSPNVIKDLLELGCDISQRDYYGRCCRQYAMELNRPDYVRVYDEYVLKTILNKNIDLLIYWILRNYDYIQSAMELKDNKLSEKVKYELTDRLYKDVDKLLRQIRYYQRASMQTLNATEENDLETIFKYSKQTREARTMDKCGRNILHRSILADNQLLCLHLIENFPHLINEGDNMNRTVLHYAYLLIGEGDIVNKLLEFGAIKVKDVKGRIPSDYLSKNLTTLETQKLHKEISEFTIWVRLHDMDFENRMKNAIQTDNLDEIENIIDSINEFVDLSFFSHLLFDCIDYNRTKIAEYLIINGCKPRIWRQDNEQDNEQDNLISLIDLAKRNGMDDLVRFISEYQVYLKNQSNELTQFEEMCNFGSLSIQ